MNASATLDRPKVDELEREAGEAVGDMPPKEPEAAHPPEVDEIVVDGTAQLELFDFGGKKPLTATIKLKGGSAKVTQGQAFKKGDRIEFSGVAVVTEVSQKDVRDKATGVAVDCVQGHTATVIDLQVDAAASA